MVPYFSAVPRNFAQNAFGASLTESRTDFRALSSPSMAQVATGMSAVWHSFIQCAVRRDCSLMRRSHLRGSVRQKRNISPLKCKRLLHILSSCEFSWWLRRKIPTLEIKNFKSSRAHFLIYIVSHFFQTALKRVNRCKIFFITLYIFITARYFVYILSFRKKETVYFY